MDISNDLTRPSQGGRPDSGKPLWKYFWDELPEEDKIEIIATLQFVLPVPGVAGVIYLFYRLGVFDPPERTNLPYKIWVKVKTGCKNNPIYKKKPFRLYKTYLPIYKKRYKKNRKRLLMHWKKNRQQSTQAYIALGAFNFVILYLFTFEISPRRYDALNRPRPYSNTYDRRYRFSV